MAWQARSKKALPLLAAAIMVLAPSMHRAASGGLLISSPVLPGSQALSVMTYNIEGLPWPVRLGREAAFNQIAARLRKMREAGGQPHIVVLQEAFAADARRIGGETGYAYVVDGPAADAPATPAAGPQDRAFEASRSFWKGERTGKLLGSGLQILSDYPVLEVRRQPFPEAACAGYDCLANKGMVLAVLAAPGPTPVAVVDVHLNSRHASGVDEARSLFAYREQVDALAAFLRANAPVGLPVIVAGDFNIGHDPQRIAYVRARLGAWLGGVPRNAFGDCLDDPGCRGRLPGDALCSLRHGRDWQFLRPGRSIELVAGRISTPFGHERGGGMLSDHIGYAVSYRAVSPSAKLPKPI